jgi:hypothetical protein
MGFTDKVAKKIRQFFTHETGHVASAGSKSDEFHRRPQIGYNVLDFYGLEQLKQQLSIDQSLIKRYIDYENMEDYPEISASYDIFADDATQFDFLKNRTVWVKSKDKKIEDILDDLLHKKLDIENEIWSLARTLVKYGNVFSENIVSEEGLIGLNFLPVPTVRRIENAKGALLGFVQDVEGNFNISPEEFVNLLQKSISGQDESSFGQNINSRIVIYEDWEVTHWRLISKHLRTAYGVGIAESARWIWKRLMLLEDALLIFKLTRAPSRYAFYIDTGTLDQERALSYVDRVSHNLKRKKFISPSTNRPDMIYNPLSMDEDFFIPTREGKDSTRVEVLSGPEFQSVEDVEYFQSKLFSALKIPKAYLGQMEDISKAVLCLSGDTGILLEGEHILTLKELSKKYQLNERFRIYSKDKNGCTVIANAYNARLTRPDAEVWAIGLDNGCVIRATPDHPFMLANGKFCELRELKIKDNLMPFYEVMNNKGKVVSIEKLNKRENCYDLTVENYHNFALSSGIFVHNSQEDVQFARSVMRVQRELCNGFKKICRVHLSALNIDPHTVDYDILMTTPSSVFDLARMEVMSSKADLASRLNEIIPLNWIFQNVFQFSEDEANELIKMKHQETINRAKSEAEAEVAASKISEMPEEDVKVSKIGNILAEERNRKQKKEHFRKLDDKLGELINNDKDFAKRLNETRKFLQDIRYNLPNRVKNT